MKWSGWLLLVSTLGTAHAFIGALFRPDDTVASLKSYYDSLTDDLLDSIASAHGLEDGRRSKRAAPVSLQDDRGVYRLQRINPLLPVCPRPIDIKMIPFNDRVHVVCVPTPMENASITFGVLDEGLTNWHQLESLPAVNARETAVFSDKGYVYIVAADSGKGDGTDLIVYDGYESRLSTEHTIHSKYATAIAIWEMVTDGQIHLAIANSNGHETSDSFEDETFTYNWMGTYFDKYAAIITYDVKDLAPFSIHSSDFLAVANHRFSESNYHIDSEIFKFDIDSKKWTSFQRIRTYGAMDWEFFSFGKELGEEHFLAVANMLEQSDGRTSYEVNSVIYKFAGDKFVPFQCLPTSGATSITAFRGPNEEFVLAVANSHESVKFYQYNGWNFVEASVQLTEGSLHRGAVSLNHFFPGYGHDVLISVANPLVSPDEPTVFSLHFEYDNQLGRWHNESLHWCDMNRRIVAESEADALVNRLNSAFFIDQREPIIIQGNVTFEEELTIQGILSANRVLNESMILDHGVLRVLQDLEEQLNDVKQKIENMEGILARALRISGNQEVTGHYVFEDVEFRCEVEDECQVGIINTRILNGEDAHDLEKKIIWTHIDQSIQVPVEVEHMIVSGDLIVSGLLNGLNTSNLVTKSGLHIVTAQKTFTETVRTRDIVVPGSVNGFDLSPENIMLTHLNQTIRGDIQFSTIEVGSLQIDGLLNGIDLDAFYEDVVTTDGEHVITGAKIIEHLVLEGDLKMLLGSTFDGVDLVDLWNNVLWKHGDQVITAPYNFSSVVLDTLTVTSTINGLRIPEDILLIDQDVNITAPKIFTETCSIGQLEVLETLSGLHIIKDDSDDYPNQLDILLKSRRQKITGLKTFETIALEGPTVVTGTIDGVKLEDLLASSVFRNATQRLDGTWIFNSDVKFLAPVRVGGLVDGVKLEELYNSALRIDDEIIPDNLHLVFLDNIKVHSLESHNVNDIDMSVHVVTKSTEQVISGVKFFDHIVLNANAEVRGFINGVDPSFINDTLMIEGDQHIRGLKKVEGDLHFRKLLVGGTINGIDTRDFVLLTGNQTITGSKTFLDIEVQGRVRVNSLETSGTINGVDIKKLVEDTMTYDGHQVVTGRKTIGLATVIEGANLASNYINGIDLSEIWEDAVLVDIPQTISGDKIFSNRVDFDQLWFYATLDGVTGWDMKENWMLQGVPQVLTGDVIFEQNLIVDGTLVVQDTISGIDLVHLNKTAVKVDEPAVIEGPVEFLKPVTVRGNVTLDGKIQGLDLSEDVVTRAGNAIITGHKRINNNLEVIGDLVVDGTVDEVSMTDLCSTTLLRHSDQVITGHMIVNGDVIFESDLSVLGLIDGVDVSHLNATCLKRDEATIVKGVKSFNTLVLNGPATVRGLLGEIDLRKLERTYMSLTKDQIVNADITFESDVHVEGPLSVGSLVTGSGLVNNVNIQELDNAVLKTYGDQIITGKYSFQNKVIFDSDVRVHGTVDGLRIPEDVMLRSRDNVIVSPKVFANNVEVTDDLSMEQGMTLQGVDVSQWASDAVYKTGMFRIAGKKTFANLTVDSVTARGRIDDVEFSESTLLLTYGDQVITGTKVIANDVIIEGDVQVGGLVNGVNLTNLQERAMLRNRNNTVTGAKTFSAPVTIGSLSCRGLVDGVRIAELEKAIYEEYGLEEVKKAIDQHQNKIDQMEKIFQTQAMCVAYYEEFQFFRELNIVEWGHVVSSTGSSMLFLTQSEPGCGVTHVYRYEFGRYTKKEELPLTPSAVRYFSVFNQTFVVFSRAMPSPQCVNQTSQNMSEGSALLYHLVPDGRLRPFQVLLTPYSTDVEIVQKADYVCLVFATVPSAGGQWPNVFCASVAELAHLRPNPFTPAATSIGRGRKASITDGNTTLLALASYEDDTALFTASVDIYLWNEDARSFGMPIQTIFLTMVKDVLLLEVPVGRGYQIMLVVAEGSVAKVGYAPGISIYKFHHGKPYPFVEMQTINEPGVQHLEWMNTAANVFLYMMTHEADNNVKIYKFKGSSGFVKEGIIDTKGAQSMLAFSHPGDVNTFIALGSSRCESRAVYSQFHQPEGLLLRSKVKGRRLPLQN